MIIDPLEGIRHVAVFIDLPVQLPEIVFNQISICFLQDISDPGGLLNAFKLLYVQKTEGLISIREWRVLKDRDVFEPVGLRKDQKNFNISPAAPLSIAL